MAYASFRLENMVQGIQLLDTIFLFDKYVGINFRTQVFKKSLIKFFFFCF